jgi:alpha-beta hydrolase superfamily lysophospholipase
MVREDFTFHSGGEFEIACYRWPAAGTAVGVVLIAHGMGEHALRYGRLAETLRHNGFHVFANDHRGHGRTTQGKTLGDFGRGGWDALVADMVTLTGIARDREAGLPIILLGHSMGSFAAQQYILDHSALIAGVVLSGSAAVDKLSLDASGPADLTALNVGIDAPRTPFDWLSRDAAEVDKYIADPLCGFRIDSAALASMAAGAERLADANELARIRKDLPIYIMAGDADPVNHNLEWLAPLAARYRAAGVKQITEKYYRGGRHEMFNETNRDEVTRNLLAWLRATIGGGRD